MPAVAKPQQPIPDPRENAFLVGHDDAERVLAEALLGQRMHHAWLITGPSGVGKATLAFRFARRLLAGPAPSLHVPPNDPLFHRVAQSTHADLLTIERPWDERNRRLKAEIPVDAVRDAVEFMRLTPAEGGWRVVVIDGAEALNRNAANALLKLLEEPPPRSVLLLACSAPGRLLPTVRSRCRRLRLRPLDRDAMTLALTRLLPDHEAAERNRLIDFAEGSPGRAIALADTEGITLTALAARVLGSAPNASPREAYEVADRLGRDDQAYGAFMGQLRHELGQAIRQASRAPSGPLPGGQAWLAARPLAQWAEVWHALGALQDETERFHLDRRQAVVSGLALLNGR